MQLYQATRDFATNLSVLVAKDDYLELFETEDGVSSFLVVVSSLALGAEICFTPPEVKRFLKKIVAS